MHKHPELAAVLGRQTATPKEVEPTSLKGKGEEVRLHPHDQRVVERIGRDLRRGNLGTDRIAVLGRRGSTLGARHWKGWKQARGVVPECIVQAAVNDITRPKFHRSAGIGAFAHAFLREAKKLAE